jgi:hypothetical protein
MFLETLPLKMQQHGNKSDMPIKALLSRQYLLPRRHRGTVQRRQTHAVSIIRCSCMTWPALETQVTTSCTSLRLHGLLVVMDALAGCGDHHLERRVR